MQLRKGLAEISISQEGFYLTAPSKLPHVPVVILLVPDAQKVPKKQNTGNSWHASCGTQSSINRSEDAFVEYPVNV